MPRFQHGRTVTTEMLQNARALIAARSIDTPAAFAAATPVDVQDFDYLFPKLQEDSANFLPIVGTTPGKLVDLGRSMHDLEATPLSDNTAIPAAYTYFGQFVDHDITLEAISGPLPALLAPDLTPLDVNAIRRLIRNGRTATLDLDSVYGFPAPTADPNNAKLGLGKVTGLGNPAEPFARPVRATGDDANDLPREGRSPDPSHDRAALTGDPRNDENLIISQLHVAFLRAHNALIDHGKSFDEARTLLRQHYQHIVLHDFLKRVADQQIVDYVIQSTHPRFDSMAEPFFMPLEFSVAAYRFGHSLVRGAYTFNRNFKPATFKQLFTFTALGGQLGGLDTLPENWIIEWENFVDLGQPFNTTRRLDTQLVEPLFHLPDVEGNEELGDGARLAVRNLLRSYLLRIPTGQAVAKALNLPSLSADDLKAVAAAASDKQLQALIDGGFAERTPLWYYILAEAATQTNGQHLGAVGSTLVAEVLVGLVRRSEDSILRTPGWVPTLPSAEAGKFRLADLLALAGVLAAKVPAMA